MRINVLDKAVAELIAAGEVVERPASIVKELVENSIDAGATAITVEIKGGGIGSIRVADNGSGIDSDDIPKAFLRHATSKVRSADDLDGILTLGFRGEALASISAVSKVELTTKTREDEAGTTYKIEGGEFVEDCPAGCPDGTTIIVRDVFYNTPARMKFLKKDVGEGNAVALAVDKCALSHPEIAFRFIRDGQVKLSTSGNGDLKAVMLAIYGMDVSDNLLPVDYSAGGVRVTGLISSPAASKPSRAYQNFFINGRYVKTRTASAALEEAFKGKITAGKFPVCALNIEIMAQCVDVNVHPAKTEVRFDNERPVFSAVYYAVKSVLENTGAIFTPEPKPELYEPEKPVMNYLEETRSLENTGKKLYDGEYTAKPTSITARQALDLFEKDESKPSAGFSAPMRLSSPSLDIYVDGEETGGNETKGYYRSSGSDRKNVWDNVNIFSEDIIIKAETTADGEELESLGGSGGGYRLAGEVFGCYILLENADGLLLVDKHAAHERIIYEKLIRDISYGHRQILLTPVSVTLSKDEYGAAAENTEAFEKLGFLVEDFGGGTILVREIPVELNGGDIGQIVGEMSAMLLRGTAELSPDALDRLYYSIACKSAVRSGDKNSRAELAEIIRRLEKNPQITHCPHGRPVSAEISRNSIEKMFGRQN